MKKSLKYGAIGLGMTAIGLFTLEEKNQTQDQIDIQTEIINDTVKSTEDKAQLILEQKSKKINNSSEILEETKGLLEQQTQVSENLSRLNKEFTINNKKYFQSFKESYLTIYDESGKVYLELYKGIVIVNDNHNHTISIGSTEYITITYQDEYDSEIEYTGFTDLESGDIIYE